MAGNPFFSGRIPKELNNSVVKHCEETGKTKTEVLVAALSNYLDIPLEEQSLNYHNEITKKQFDSLADRVALLEDILLDNKDIIVDNVSGATGKDILTLSGLKPLRFLNLRHDLLNQACTSLSRGLISPSVAHV